MKIMGTVYGDGETLPYANVVVNTNVFGQTDENGDFDLINAAIKADTPVKISYMGFETQTFRASELVGKSVTLPISSFLLDEVLITGTPVKATPKKPKDQNPVLAHIIKHKKSYLIGTAALIVGSFFLIKKANV